MQSNEDEDNPLAALIKRAEEEEGKKGDDGGDPIIVFSGSNEFNEDDNQDNGPITLSIRQPSFSHLTCGNLVPKGGNESISKSNKNFKFKQNDSLSKEKHSSSYANIKILIDPALKKEVKESQNSNLVPDIDNNSNPILVITGHDDSEDDDDDQSNVPIGLSVRQPSFASLCSNHIVPKGGLETGEMPVLIEEEPPKASNSNQIEDNGDDNLAPALGLQVRQSSYARLHLNTPQKEEVTDLMKIAIKEEDSKLIGNGNETKNVSVSANSSNPVLVLTGNNESDDEKDDDNGTPIGLSVRQPSFASLCNHIIPKGGLETGDMPIVIEEEWPGEEDQKEIEQIKEIEEEIENENGPMTLNVRQSSYANLHFGSQPSNSNPLPSIETIPDEEVKPKEQEKKNTENEDTIIVLTNDDSDKDDGAPIGLSVRQPSFASLTGNVIPKGGFQPTVPTITEESNDRVLDQEISDVDIESSSESEDKYEMPKTDPIQKAKQTNENNENNNIEDDPKKEPAMRDKILSSLLSINKQWWEEIGYNPPDNIRSLFPRSNSMFQVPASKEFMKNSFGSSNSNEIDLNSKSSNSSISPIKKRPSHSLYQGQLNTINDLLKDGDSTKVSSRKGELSKDKRGPSIYRVNSYGNKTELIEVEMPLLNEINYEEENEDDEENSFLNNSREFMTKDVKQNNEPSQIAQNESEEEQSAPQPQSTKNANEQTVKMARGPSMQRVSSFGNASTLKVVEMPTISEETQNKNQIQNKEETEFDEEENEYEEEEEEEDNHDIPPEILKMMTKPRDPIVYSALCGASINGYKRETVHRALTDLKSMNKKCQDRDLDMESEFLVRVIDGIRQDAARDDPYFEVEEQMRETEVELQEKLADWQNIYEELDEEYKVQVEECEQRYQEDLLSIEKQFHTTTNSGTSDSNKRPNSDSKINQSQETENDTKTEDTSATTENGLTVIDTNPKYSVNKRRSNITVNSPSNRKRHSSLTPNSATILSPSISGKPFQPQKPQQRSKATVYSTTAPKPQLFQSISPSISPETVKMKEKVQKMIKAQRFEESFELSLKYYKRQMAEHQKQVNKRSQAFLAAKTALKQKHEDERKEIEFNFQAKRAEFTKKREQSLVPLRQQIIQLRKMKSLIEEGEKNEKLNESMQPRLRASRTRKSRVANLALPPLSKSSNA